MISTSLQQALSNLHYKIMPASEGTYVDSVKHSDLFIDPISKAKSIVDSIPLPGGATHLPPIQGVQAI